MIVNVNRCDDRKIYEEARLKFARKQEFVIVDNAMRAVVENDGSDSNVDP